MKLTASAGACYAHRTMVNRGIEVTTKTRRIPAGLAALVCAASGIGVSFCFWPYRTGFLAFVVLIPFVVASGIGDGRGRYILNSFVFGFAYFMSSLYWIAMLGKEQIAVPWLRLPAAVALCLYLSIFMVLTGWLARRLVILGVPFVIALALAWAAMEYLRSLGPLGFTWADIGYSQTPYVRLVQMASVVGTYGIGALIVLVNAMLAGLLMGRGRFYALAAALAVLIPAAAGHVILRGAEPGRTVAVSLIQPDISGSVKWDKAQSDTTMAILERLTLRSRDADLIVWPETAVPFHALREPFEIERIAGLAEATGSHILVGCPDYEYHEGEVRYFNSAFLMSPSGTVEGIYRKIHLVPFGEMFPFEDRFEILKRIDLGQGDFSPGTDLTIFHLDGSPFAVAICFESIYPGLVGDFVKRGARLIVNITNDEWFGPSLGPSQHAQMAVMRSVEYRIGLARCANTGISMIADPYGRVVERTRLFTRDILTGPVEVGTGDTIYARIGGRLEIVLLVACLGLAVMSYMIPSRRVKRFDTPSESVLKSDRLG
jgi:apolipoprotein N-acyltransferase